MVVQTIGLVIHPLIALAGTALLIAGLAYYAKAKGHSGWYGLLGLLSWFGIIGLILLKDRRETAGEREARKNTRPADLLLGILLAVAMVIGVPVLIFFLATWLGQ